VFFRIKRSTQLKKLMNAYCDRQSVDMTAIAFLFDGRRLRAEQTPDEVLSVTFEQNLQLVNICHDMPSL
jgi:small ubiquitin-related modifier